MTNHLRILLITGALLLLACPDSGDEEGWIDPSIYTIGVDGSNEQRLTENGNYFGNPVFADGGNKIVFDGYGDGKDESIFIADADGSNRTWLASGAFPVISPDGQKILFQVNEISFQGEEPTYYSGSQLAIMNLDGSGLSQLTIPDADTVHEHHYNASFSPDGKKIVYNYQHRQEWEYVEEAVYMMNADGSEKTRLFDRANYWVFPKFTAAGSRIVFNSGGWSWEGREDEFISLYDPATGMITDLVVAYECGGLDASQVGSLIVYETKSGLHQEIFAVNIDGANRRRLTNDSPGHNRNPRFSPDGTKIVFVGMDENDMFSHIMVMDSDGSDLKNLTEGTERFNGNPSFSRDGQVIVFTANY